jgi:hypothetical protein
MVTVSIEKPLNRHAGLDPASRTHLAYWIPAFAGMTLKQLKLTFCDFIKVDKRNYDAGQITNRKGSLD